MYVYAFANAISPPFPLPRPRCPLLKATIRPERDDMSNRDKSNFMIPVSSPHIARHFEGRFTPTKESTRLLIDLYICL